MNNAGAQATPRDVCGLRKGLQEHSLGADGRWPCSGQALSVHGNAELSLEVEALSAVVEATLTMSFERAQVEGIFFESLFLLPHSKML